VRGEGPEVDSTTEAICRLVDDYDLTTFLAEAAEKAWVSNDQLAALQRLDAALSRYADNGEDGDDATRIQSPGWQKIRKLAKATLETFPTRGQRLTASGSGSRTAS
jgi:hypothetical protein